MLPGWAQAPPSTRHCPPLLSGSLRVPVRCCPRPGFVLSASRRQAPEYIWHLCRGPYVHPTAVSVREFLLQSEDWMVMAFYDASGTPVPQPPPLLHRLAFESDAFRRRSMFDGVAPSKADWWAFSQRFVDGLASCGVKPRVVGSSCQRLARPGQPRHHALGHRPHISRCWKVQGGTGGLTRPAEPGGAECEERALSHGGQILELRARRVPAARRLPSVWTS
ncbi:unnamed protein product [Prorocentrum cordatum]|uniref:Uncharacterized protein n=1 Tax=Prorocentrum cordatum TaxID=2364126 RepID=A0ABN9S9L2_9DINO|nr:unnamed protein product [Polarella glacialis]